MGEPVNRAFLAAASGVCLAPEVFALLPGAERGRFCADGDLYRLTP